MKLGLSILLYLLCCVWVLGQDAVFLSYKVDSITNSAIRCCYYTSISSPTLPLGRCICDGAYNTSFAGVRFVDLEVPQSSTIDSAFIQFSSSEGIMLELPLEVSCEDSAQAPYFWPDYFNMIRRPLTSARVPWLLKGLLMRDDRGPELRTPNLASILQEVVDRADWSEADNAVVFLFKPVEEVPTITVSLHSYGADVYPLREEHLPELIIYLKPEEGEAPAAENWAQLRSNPFSEQTALLLNLGEADELRWRIYDASGREAYGGKGAFAAGRHEISLRPLSAFPAGVYFLNIRSGRNSSKTFKLLKAR